MSKVAFDFPLFFPLQFSVATEGRLTEKQSISQKNKAVKTDTMKKLLSHPI